ncbi:Topless-related protein 3 [Cardamine amara subsp. amara]|uniref:Topless-related protein 3 n=1 Tax=Cardamine amara subsp. amara TaxID=228776 RepID=A0ABD0ZXL3_CARAN
MAWNFDKKDSLADYNAPSGWCTRLLYSADGRKLFSCGTSQLGTSSLMEITEAKGTIKKVYNGLTTQLGGVVQFQSSKNHFLAAGEDGLIKFWHVDNVNILSTTDAEGGLEAFPCLRFDKEDNLLAVSTSEGFKVLANPTGLKSLR